MKKPHNTPQEGRKLLKPETWFCFFFKLCSSQFQYCLSSLNVSHLSGKIFKQQFHLWATRWNKI